MEFKEINEITGIELHALKEKWEGEAVMGFVKTLPEKITNVVGGYPLRVEIKARWKEWVSGKCRFCGEPLSIENKLRKEGIGVKGFCNNEECERYLTKTKEQEAPKLQNMVENPATYPSNTLLSRIFPKRLSNSLHNKVTVDRNRSQEWLCIETVDDLTNLINKYGFEKIEDTKNIGSIGVAEIAQLYGLTVHEMRSKNPRMLLVKPLQINNLTKTKEQEGEK